MATTIENANVTLASAIKPTNPCACVLRNPDPSRFIVETRKHTSLCECDACCDAVYATGGSYYMRTSAAVDHVIVPRPGVGTFYLLNEAAECTDDDTGHFEQTGYYLYYYVLVGADRREYWVLRMVDSITDVSAVERVTLDALPEEVRATVHDLAS